MHHFEVEIFAFMRTIRPENIHEITEYLFHSRINKDSSTRFELAQG